MASPVAVEATTSNPPAVPKRMRQKVKVVKPTVNMSQAEEEDGIAICCNIWSCWVPNQISNQPSLPVATPSTSRYSKPFPSQYKKKDKAVALPPRYSFETAYSNYFFLFENERLIEKYITPGFIVEKPIKLDSFRALGIQKLIEDWG